MIDFTNAKIDKISKYGGSDKKRGIIYNNKRYMLKLSDEINESKRNSLNSSYSNSVYSEDLSCRILKCIGFQAQNTLLGTISMTSSKGNLKVYPAVACENFEDEDYRLVEFKVMENVLLDKKPPKTPHIEDIYEILQSDNVYFDRTFGEAALKEYWNLFVADALLGNFDRHANNWGYLISETTGEIKLAPVYDCGSCLYPQLSDDSISRILSDTDEIKKRIEIFPSAALIVNGKKVNYKNYIASFENNDCTAALNRIYPKIDLDQINKEICKTEGISEIRKEFYSVMVQNRYEQIIRKAYIHQPIAQMIPLAANRNKSAPKSAPKSTP